MKKNIKFKAIVCGLCGVIFALTKEHVEHLRDSHKSFRCPNGCENYFPTDDDDDNGDSKAEETPTPPSTDMTVEELETAFKS